MFADTKVTDAMAIVALLAYTGAFKAIYAGWAVRETSSLFRMVATQRRRYAFVVVGQGILALCAAWLLSLGSISDIVAGVKEWFALDLQEWSVFQLFGWMIGSGVVLVAVSPFISLLALVSIYRRPSVMAYKRFGRNEFRSTSSYRAGRLEFFEAITLPSGGRFGRVFVAI